MARALWLASALRGAGLGVVETSGWTGRGWSTVNFRGLVWHHTASRPGSNAPSLDVVINGRPGLPGPLCQVLLARDGTCYIVASGGANHAGEGSWKGLSGNSSVMAIEAENSGVGEPWSAQQYDAYVRAAIVMTRHMGTSAVYNCGHKEWAPTRKIDPTGIDMNRARRHVAVGRVEEVEVPSQQEWDNHLKRNAQAHREMREEMRADRALILRVAEAAQARDERSRESLKQVRVQVAEQGREDEAEQSEQARYRQAAKGRDARLRQGLARLRTRQAEFAAEMDALQEEFNRPDPDPVEPVE